jgi:hypothetical protein
MEAIKGQRTAQENAAIYGVHPTQVTTRKKQLIPEAAEIFTRGGVYDKEAIEWPNTTPTHKCGCSIRAPGDTVSATPDISPLTAYPPHLSIRPVRKSRVRNCLLLGQ